MNNISLLSAFHQALWVILISVCLITIPTLIVGVIVSILQAATQVNEMSLTFIPKLIVLFLILIALLPWLLQKLVDMTQIMMYNLPSYLR